MLFEAAYWRPETPRPQLEEGLSDPDLAKILADWGRDGDLAVIAHDTDKDLGAAWLRFWTDANHSYGFVNESIPELGIGVVAQHRGQGIGRALIRELIRLAVERGISQISLSVEQDNFSRDLYASEGFKTVDRIGNSDTMLLSLERS
jgi:ribosomal protein S18 acetylase RimI-like enzyme